MLDYCVHFLEVACATGAHLVRALRRFDFALWCEILRSQQVYQPTSSRSIYTRVSRYGIDDLQPLTRFHGSFLLPDGARGYAKGMKGEASSLCSYPNKSVRYVNGLA